MNINDELHDVKNQEFKMTNVKEDATKILLSFQSMLIRETLYYGRKINFALT